MTARPAAVVSRGLTVRYGPTEVLRGIELTVGDGQATALLGPSGSGKTTLLSTIAGFLRPSGGEVWIGGRLVADHVKSAPPEQRRVGVVFQHFALWPHLSALETVAYPLERQGLPRRDARREARDVLGLVGLDRLADRRPAELSGGEQQRVGLARALARRPDVFLFDEPTAQLDAELRTVLQAEIGRVRRSAGRAALYATHDVSEAFAIADRVAVMRDGRILQEGSPQDVYERPIDEWVARLTGTASVLDVIAGRSDDGRIEVEVDGRSVSVEADGRLGGRRRARVVVRPEWASLGGMLSGRVRDVRYGGSSTDYLLDAAGAAVVIREQGGPRLRAGEEVGWSLRRVHVLDDPANPLARPTGSVVPEAT